MEKEKSIIQKKMKILIINIQDIIHKKVLINMKNMIKMKGTISINIINKTNI